MMDKEFFYILPDGQEACLDKYDSEHVGFGDANTEDGLCAKLHHHNNNIYVEIFRSKRTLGVLAFDIDEQNLFLGDNTENGHVLKAKAISDNEFLSLR